MKKLLFVIALITFSFSANAQESKALNASAKNKTAISTPEEEATKDAKKVQEILGLSDSRTQDFIGLFKQKYETLAVKDISNERKAELSRIIDLKMRASLDANEMSKLESNKEFYKKIVN